MDPLPRPTAGSRYAIRSDGTIGSDDGEHVFPLAGPLPEFEGGLVTAEELRVLFGRDEDA